MQSLLPAVKSVKQISILDVHESVHRDTIKKITKKVHYID
jgi:hypothetical protein